jgi:hypothetical protein
MYEYMYVYVDTRVVLYLFKECKYMFVYLCMYICGVYVCFCMYVYTYLRVYYAWTIVNKEELNLFLYNGMSIVTLLTSRKKKFKIRFKLDMFWKNAQNMFGLEVRTIERRKKQKETLEQNLNARWKSLVVFSSRLKTSHSAPSVPQQMAQRAWRATLQSLFINSTGETHRHTAR